jgi:dolichyl-phosphate beta-glucosyltransferase
MSRDVVLVIPCYDEASRLRPDAFRGAALANQQLAIVFVDDGSRDETRAVLEDLCVAGSGEFSLVSHPLNLGKAEAVRTGISHALARGARYVGYWDADLSTPLAEVGALAAHLDHDPGLQAVFGSRVRRLGTRIVRRASRHYFGRVFATAVSLLTGVAVYDSQCGAKLFRANEATRRIFAEPFISRWLFDVEIVFRLSALRREAPDGADDLVYEHPLTEWIHDPGSRLRPAHWLGAPLDLLRIWNAYRG